MLTKINLRSSNSGTMRFLLLHGYGTNSAILEAQIQAITKKLGQEHDFIYVDGEEEVLKARGLPPSVPGPYLGYYSEYIPEQISKALDLIDAVIEEDGPFDGVLGFSQGASLILSYLVQHEITNPDTPPAFRFAILFSPFTAISPDPTFHDNILAGFGELELKLFEELMMNRGASTHPVVPSTASCRDPRIRSLLDVILPTLVVGFKYNFIYPEHFETILEDGNPDVLPRVLVPSLIEERIRIPVVHVIGRNDDPLFKAQADTMKGLCTPTMLHCIKHSLGHDIPRGGPEVDGIVREIEWAMDASRKNHW